jgi:hypothetical protein
VDTIFESRNPYENECHIDYNMSEKARKRMSVSGELAIRLTS